MSEVKNLFDSVPKDGANSALTGIKKVEQERNAAIAKKHNVEVLATYNTTEFTLDTKDKL